MIREQFTLLQHGFHYAAFSFFLQQTLSIFPYIRNAQGLPETLDFLQVVSSSPILGIELT